MLIFIYANIYIFYFGMKITDNEIKAIGLRATLYYHPFGVRFEFPVFIFSLSIYKFCRAGWLREALGGKRRAEAVGDAAAKKRACKLFLPPCVPTACARGLTQSAPDPSEARGHA